MSFKLVILCAVVAVISCTTVHDRNEQFREQNQQLENQQQQQQFDHQHNQEQFNRERNQFDNDGRQHFNYRQNQFNTNNNNGFRPFTYGNNNNNQHPTFYHLQPAFISVPGSHRNFNQQDDSHYNFGYTISDVTTGDYKSHQETRQGDNVQGQFSMIDSDGFRRTVNYRADDANGFNAEVRRDPTNTAFAFQQQQPQQQFNSENQNAAFFNAAANVPKSTTSTQVTRLEDGQQTNYATQTTNF